MSLDLSAVYVDVDRDGSVDLACEVCPEVWIMSNPNLSIPALVAAAEKHVREKHVTVVESVVL